MSLYTWLLKVGSDDTETVPGGANDVVVEIPNSMFLNNDSVSRVLLTIKNNELDNLSKHMETWFSLATSTRCLTNTMHHFTRQSFLIL